MIIRIRSRDGLERVSVDITATTTVGQLKSAIESQLGISSPNHLLSTHQNLLLAKTPQDLALFNDMANPNTLLSSLRIAHGSIVFMAYEGERIISGPTAFSPAGSFGKKMTMEDLIAKQMRITRQENPHCELVSFDAEAVNAFQSYVNNTLAFAVKRGGIMYGRVSESGKVEVDFIYEPPQQGTEQDLILMRDPGEEKLVEAIALGFGMRKVGFIFSETVSQDKKDYTMSSAEVLQAVEMHVEGDLKEWVTTVVKLQVDEDGGTQVHVEAFQMSDMCVRLFKEGWFDREVKEDADVKVSRMTKEVMVAGKDTREVDNDFLLVAVKIADHQSEVLSTRFPIENRICPVTVTTMKSHLDRVKREPLPKRISDFHLLLMLARFLDVDCDVPVLAACVQAQETIPDGFQLIIDSLSSLSLQ